ncbi:hypothetical protein PIB30_107946, partial [Stylosanthes scabra]|nr:hypothetical protein [Stylosanthes scabra]
PEYERYGRNGHGNSEDGELRHHQQWQRRYFLPLVTPIDGDRAVAWNRGFFKHQRRHRNPRRRQHHGPTTTVAVPLSCSVLQRRRWDGVVSEGKARWQGMQRHSSSLLVSHSLLSVSLSFSISISLFVLASSSAAPWPSIAGAVIHLLPPVSKPVIPFPLAFC